MATYRFEAKVIGRSQGRSATASAAYRAAERIDDARTGQSFDYTRKGGVLHAEILTPAGTPDWMRNRSQLWNAVEQVERRKDAQLARDLILSLPHELSADQRRDLVRNFVSDEFVAKGMIADIAIHAPDKRGDQRNHHAHVMLTMRELSGSGFGLKAREWNDTDLLEQWRERWAHAVNRQLERYGHAARVDHRSLEDQGIDREPEPKQGAVATKLEREGQLSNAGDDRRAAKARNAERAEIAAELRAIEAEIIDLDAERLKRGAKLDKIISPDERDGRDDMAEDERSRARQSPSIGTTSGGMVAQTTDAQERFERNSKALQARQVSQAHQRNDAPAKDASNQNARAEAQRPEGKDRQDAADQSRHVSSREQYRRLKGQPEGKDLAADGKDHDQKSPGQDDKLQRFKDAMAKSFSRDDPGDRSR
jgi:ATP-dependent exoDNAse (exonuclease V) alpha subunit